MKHAIVFGGLFTLTVFLGAQDTRPSEPKKEPARAAVERKMGEAVPVVMEKDREVYGAVPKLKESVKLADVMKDPKAFEGKTVQVKATIGSVCLKRGCWMVLKDGEAETRVKFAGYKFFVPLDVAGRCATVEGKPEVKVVTEAMRRHYAEDAGKPKDEIMKIVGDETVVTFMAEAVEIGGKPPAADDCCEGEVNSDGSVKKKEGCCGTKSKSDGSCCSGKKDAPKKDS